MKTLHWVDPEGNHHRQPVTRTEYGKACRSVRRLGGSVVNDGQTSRAR